MKVDDIVKGLLHGQMVRKMLTRVDNQARGEEESGLRNFFV